MAGGVKKNNPARTAARGAKGAAGRLACSGGKRLRRRLAAVAAAAVIVAACWLSPKLYGAVITAGREIPSVPVFFCQRDAAWSGDALGRTGRTLGEGGAEVACLASLLSMQRIAPEGLAGSVDPGTLNAWLTERDAYGEDGRLDWTRVGELLGVDAVEVPAGYGLDRRVEGLLEREVYPIARVRRGGAVHDVLVVGSVHGEFLIADPMDPAGAPDSLADYGNRVRGLRYLDAGAAGND